MSRILKSLSACLVLATVTLPTVAVAQPAPMPPDPAAPDPAAPPMPPADPAAGAPMMAPPMAPIQQTMAPPPAEMKNVMYLELGGNAGFYSLNFERFIKPDMAIRAGLMYFSIGASSGDSSASVTWAAVPVMFEYFGVASGSHALELGGGIAFNYLSGMSSSGGASAGATGVVPIATLTLGYRYSNPAGGFVFKAGYTPLIAITAPDQEPADYSRLFHWGGMSFGYRF